VVAKAAALGPAEVALEATLGLDAHRKYRR